ncbi:MAG: phenylacetate-CoA oxygenase subunit PaaJ [Burkholderiales bacterium]|nr:phenylacetate-CoA oxygenase subunit PaaJ [Burkholderiales bacterium]
MLDNATAWTVLDAVLDPEVPVLSVVELGIVRAVSVDAMTGAADVVVTPTYSGCPATEVIADAIRDALLAAGATQVAVRTQLEPAWTTDWLAPGAAEKLRAYGIAPPGARADGAAVVRFVPRRPPCPRCGSRATEQLSRFGATACKALYRCTDCREPFEHFKPI